VCPTFPGLTPRGSSTQACLSSQLYTKLWVSMFSVGGCADSCLCGPGEQSSLRPSSVRPRLWTQLWVLKTWHRYREFSSPHSLLAAPSSSAISQAALAVAGRPSGHFFRPHLRTGSSHSLRPSISLPASSLPFLWLMRGGYLSSGHIRT